MTKKRHFKPLYMLTFIVSASFVASLAGSLAYTFVEANYLIDEGTYFVAEDGDTGHMFKCYEITNTNIQNSIAVAWNRVDGNPMPSSLEIPSTITHNDTTYHVKAIAKGGFRNYPDMTSVIVPQTVEEIREEAFAFCTGLTSFQIPKDVTEIAPSTFLDCRALEVVYYSNGLGNPVLGNNVITTIGDHAFDSCVSLKGFTCSSKLTTIGISAFQKCESLPRFTFPNDNGGTGDDRNLIDIGAYAFANCKELDSVYFDVNMHSIGNYAFANCKNDMKIRYTGSSAPSFSEHWRRKFNNTSTETNPVTSEVYGTAVYSLQLNQSRLEESPDYPGLSYTIDTASVKLDNARTNATEIYVLGTANSSPGSYINIYQFIPPAGTQAGYWDATNGILTIPNTITINETTYTVKIIGADACNNNECQTKLKKVIFNENLVQIQHRAFFSCTNIAELDFTNCEDLVEIGYSIFQEVEVKAGVNKEYCESNDALAIDQQIYNEALTEIVLPNCLQYLGNFAFYNFLNLVDGISFKTNPSQPSQLKMIGDYAFSVVALSDSNKKSWTPSKTIDVELPNSLNDSYASRAKFYSSFSFKKNELPIQQRYAIGKNVFDNQQCIGSITMEPSTDTSYTTSFASNGCNRCYNLTRFKTNENFCLLGKDFFKSCYNLREVFMCSTKAAASSFTNPWGIEDKNNNYGSDGIFSGVSKPNAVIYVSGSSSPNGNTNIPWNGEKSGCFKNELDGNSLRPLIPTYYNVDWLHDRDIVYWQINKTQNEILDIADRPAIKDDFNSGIISFVKQGSGYALARYYSDGTDEHVAKAIDLTSSTLTSVTVNGVSGVNLSNNITKIGDSAFATAKENVTSHSSTTSVGGRGFCLVLPNPATGGVTEIGDRAFYREETSQGMRVVTYDNSGTPVGEPGGSSYDTVRDQTGDGYCCLPNSITKISRNAFYNNRFKKIKLSNNLYDYGTSAFYRTSSNGVTTSIEFNGSNSTYTAIGNGIYYTADANKKTLVLQANGNQTALSIDNGTVAIGYRAAASTKYTSVDFPSSLTTIYGQAFAKSTKLTELTGLSSIKYINAYAKDPDVEVYDDSLPFEALDYTYTVTPTDTSRKATMTGAFENCTELTTVDFTTMTSLKKIGRFAFNNCKKLAQMTGGTTSYTFKTYDGTTYTNEVTKSTGLGVLDLRPLKNNLRVIEGKAFESCSKMDYVIMPNTSLTGESQLYYGYDPLTTSTNNATYPFRGGAKKLLGETFKQANEAGDSTLKPTTHYPTGSYTGYYSSTYYRCRTTGAQEGSFKGDIYTGNLSGRKYWTVLKDGTIILFENGTDADTWLTSHPDRNNQITTY